MMTDESLVHELAFVLRRNSGAPAERYAQALTLLRAHVAANRTETARACAEICDRERLVEDLDNDGDRGYNAGVDDCERAIRARFLGGEG